MCWDSDSLLDQMQRWVCLFGGNIGTIDNYVVSFCRMCLSSCSESQISSAWLMDTNLTISKDMANGLKLL